MGSVSILTSSGATINGTIRANRSDIGTLVVRARRQTSEAVVSRGRLPSTRGPEKCQKQEPATVCPRGWGTLGAGSKTAIVAASHRRDGIFEAFEQEIRAGCLWRALFKGGHWLRFQHGVKRWGRRHAMEENGLGGQRCRFFSFLPVIKR